MLKCAERFLLVAALGLLGVFAYAYATPQLQAARSVQSFKQARVLATVAPDTTLWSEQRIHAYAEAPRDVRAIGVLKIDAVDIEAPIFPGAADSTLDLGIGHIPGTAKLGTRGNTGLAAHRDGFFRGLKDIELGDKITLTGLHEELTYTVTGTDIIDPSDVYVLAPTSRATLTLVTCYPFYFSGSAPNRFVVFAVLDTPDLATDRRS